MTKAAGNPSGRRWFVLALAAVAVGALALSAFRGTEDKATLADLVGQNEPGPIHVHGLGVNPSDGALFIATHTGMYRVSPGESKAQPVTNRYQDTMGFTIIGEDRLLGSGHPNPTEAREKGLPALLGLIESRDAGRSWRPISLLGEADFHILRSAGNLVYGYDATNKRFLLSRNAGRTWLSRTAPAPLLDLVVDPGRPAHLIASAQAVLFESFDEGERWQVRGTQSGFLTWPAQDELFIIQGSGDVLTSRDSGRGWLWQGSIGGEPAAVLGRAANDLYVALHDGTIKRSVDGGRSWSVRSRP